MKNLFRILFVIWIAIWSIGILYAVVAEGFDLFLIAVFLMFSIVGIYGYDLFMHKTAQKIKFTDNDVTFTFFDGKSFNCHKNEVKKVEAAPKGEILYLSKKKIHTLKSMLEIENADGSKEKRQVQSTDFPTAIHKDII